MWHVAAHQGALTIRECAYNAICGALHDRVAKAVASVDDLSIRLSDLCFGAEKRVLSRLEFDVADNAVVEELLLAVVSQLCSCQACIGSLLRSLSCVQGSLIGDLVDDEERLALYDLLSFCDAKLLQRAAHLRIDLDILSAANGRAVVCGHRHVFGLDCHCLEVGTRHLLLCLVAAA